MPRDHARVNLTIWTDPDFRALPPAGQHLYFTLWTAPKLSYCGVHDWRPARMTGLSSGFTAEHIETVASCLEARHFFVIDRDTEECLIRSWARFDGLMKEPIMAVSLVNAYAATASQTIRGVIVHELHKIRDEIPEASSWAKPKVAEVLGHPAISAKDLPVPADPFDSPQGLGQALPLPLGLPLAQGPAKGKAQAGANPSPYTPPTPAPAPAPKPSVVEGGVGGDDSAPKTARKRASTLPEDFEPNETNQKLAADRGLDLDAVVAHFTDHHLAKGSAFVDWQRALSTWLRRERSGDGGTPIRRIPDARNLEQPPDGLTPDEYDEWERAARERRRA